MSKALCSSGKDKFAAELPSKFTSPPPGTGCQTFDSLKHAINWSATNLTEMDSPVACVCARHRVYMDVRQSGYTNKTTEYNKYTISLESLAHFCPHQTSGCVAALSDQVTIGYLCNEDGSARACLGVDYLSRSCNRYEVDKIGCFYWRSVDLFSNQINQTLAADSWWFILREIEWKKQSNSLHPSAERNRR